ncbi:hypothetical protein CupriaWKF_20100 [Cupriavidus sp. WKF15]|uniref:bestrophin-like domain n=1 Tax=Cupriavidus sp. WKF15 TaxID=3032282 RepID=UPI0023E282AF|nr:hypothetical protein [Cupriavidus sp. WKF15]WER49452.1 hypothetical protein CupriaWKF_20100 [Cupriavidus sp. WKF15]
MSIFRRCFAIALINFFCAIAGVYAHTLFPIDIDLSIDAIRSISSLIGTLFAIVLGLLVSSSYAAFNNHQADLNSLVSAIANIDLLLKHFPDVSARPRMILRELVVDLLGRYWPKNGHRHGGQITYNQVSEDVGKLLEINDISVGFKNMSRDDIKALRDYSSNFVSVQSNIVRSLSNQVPALLLVIVFGWACLLFFLYGSFSGGHMVALIFMLLGAIAIASASFLILELTHPYHGIFKVSCAPLELLLQSMIQEAEFVKAEPSGESLSFVGLGDPSGCTGRHLRATDHH